MASFSFDVATFEWAATLVHGAMLVLAPRQSLLPGPHLSAVFARWQLSHLPSSPVWLSAMEPPEHEYPRVVFAGGEAGNPQTSARWMVGRRHLNAYGPTEITIVCSMLNVDETHLAYSHAFKRPLLLAGPFDNVQLYVVDRWGQPVSLGVIGELWIGGVGVTRGYHNRPGLTARQFVPDPFATLPGGRLYRSGDLVRQVQLDSGQHCLDFIGRIDFQVKLRGLRIELAEIEAVLAETEGVTGVVVQLHGTGEAAVLVAYLQSDQELADPLALAKARLPQFMVPSQVVVLRTFPKTSSDKVDLKALPKPSEANTKKSHPPATNSERLLATIWAQVLDGSAEGIGRDDNFFQLGGHSLLAVRLANQIRAQFGVELEVRTLFAHPTLRAQAEAIGSGLSPTLLLPEPVPRTHPERRLSHAQNTLWFLDQLEGSGGDGRLGGAYNIPIGWTVGGLLDVSALDRTLTDLITLFPILRSVYPSVAGRPSVQLLPPETLALRVIDLRATADPETALSAYVDAEQHHSFPLGTGPLFRATLLWLQDTRSALMINQHHIIADGWSMGLLRDSLLQQYAAHLRGSALAVAPPELDYWDYAQWQHQLREAGLLDQQLAWWKQTLAPVPTRLEFPTDKPRPKVQTFRGDSTPIRINRPLSDALSQLERRLGLTSFMSWHALVALLLARHSGQNCVCIGSPVAGRSHARLEPIYGMFVSMLPVAHVFNPQDSLENLLTTTRDRVLACFAHAEVPFDSIVESAVQQRDLSHPPLFQVLLSVMNLPDTDQLAGHIDLEPLSFEDDQTKFELGFTFVEDPDGRSGILQYNTDLFDRESIVRLARRLEFLVAELVRDTQQTAAQVSLLTPDQDRQLLDQLNQVPYTAFAPLTVAEQVPAWARSQPDRPALCFTRADGFATNLSYAALDDLSERLAHQLQTRGFGLGARIGICMPPSLERMVAVIAIHKAGGLYVPLDPEYPSERLHFMVTDAQVSLLFSQPETVSLTWPEGVVSQLLELEAVAQLPRATRPTVDPEHSAYIIYTSGSTGTPKGVLMPHLGLNHIVAQLRQPLDVGPQTRFLQVASFNFDVSVLEWALALSSGGCLVLVPRADLLPGPDTLARLQTWRVSHIAPTPAWLSAVVWDESALTTPPAFPQVVISAGEACSPQLAERWAQGRRFVNGYGPTENAILTTVAEIDDPVLDACRSRQRGIPLGGPFGQVTAYVLDRRGEPVPPGVAGELCSGGVGLARGYLDRPGQTATRFVPDPFSSQPGSRLYRTGDLVRLSDLGTGPTLDYLGRIDHQVKLRGFRIELGEIEAALLAEDSVQEAVALIHTSATGNRFLLAFVGGSCESDSSREALRSRLRSRLPEYMVPAHLVWLAQFPTSGAGKVDRGRLAAQTEALLAHRSDSWLAPRSLSEQQLAAIWSNLLGLSHIGANQDFFQLGGHSLLAVRLADEIFQVFGQKLPVSALFLHSTLEAQAQWLDQKTHQEGPLVTLQPGQGQPWFFIHPIGGQVHWYLPLARLLQPNPCYALQAQGLSDGPPPTGLAQMVQDYVAAVQQTQPQGPYRLFGWSAGGTLALAMAHELEQRQEHPVEVVLLDAYRFPEKPEPNLRAEVLQFLSDLQAGQPRHAPQTYLEALAQVTSPEEAWRALEQAKLLPEGWSSEHLQRYHAVTHAIGSAISGFQVPPLRGPIRHYQAQANREQNPGWDALPQLQTTVLEGDHYSLLTPAQAPVLAEKLHP